MTSPSPDLVDLAFSLLKDARNRCFSYDFSDCWEAVSLILGAPLVDGTLTDRVFEAAAAGNAKAQFVAARLIRAERLHNFYVAFNRPTRIPRAQRRLEMHRQLKAAAIQGLAPAIREWRANFVRTVLGSCTNGMLP